MYEEEPKAKSNGYPIEMADGAPNEELMQEYREYASTNRAILDLINWASSLEFCIGRYALKSRMYSVAIGWIRLIICLNFVIRAMVVYVLNSCESSEFRYSILDWTVVYPPSYRFKLLRVMICINFISIIVKRSVLSKESFDTAFQDHMINVPNLRKSSFSRSPRASKELGQHIPSFMVNPTSDCEKTDLYMNIKFRLATISKKPRAETSGLLSYIDLIEDQPSRISNEQQQDSRLSNANRASLIETRSSWMIDRGIDHWIAMSKYVKAGVFKFLLIFGISCSGVVFMAGARILFMLNGARDCDILDTRLRIIGTFEVTIVFVDFYGCIAGALGYVWLVHSDLMFLADDSDRKLSEVIHVHVKSKHQNSSSSQGSIRFTEYNEVDNLFRSNQEFVLGFVSNYPIRHPNSISDTSKPEDDLLASQTADAQMSVIKFLIALDGHKKSMTFLGNFIYVWLILSLSLVPLILERDMKGLLSYSIYIFMLTSAVVSCLYYSILCGHVNARAMQIERAIFKISYRTQNILKRTLWNKVLLLWFNPNRCSFCVCNTLELTYVNIMKSLSFVLSGLALILNYSH